MATALQTLENVIIGEIVRAGPGGVNNEVLENSPSMILAHDAGVELGVNLSFSSDIVRVVIGRMVEEGRIKVIAPGGVPYCVIAPKQEPAAATAIEINLLRQRVTALEADVQLLKRMVAR